MDVEIKLDPNFKTPKLAIYTSETIWLAQFSALKRKIQSLNDSLKEQ